MPPVAGRTCRGRRARFWTLGPCCAIGAGLRRPAYAWPRQPHRRLAQPHLSPRQFSRAFLAETGQSPARAIEKLRVETARALIEDGHSIDRVAEKAGFADPERMRRAFHRAFGQPPQALKRAARLQAA
jgi:methylphosphotriester-DNA--protein-cysteine methyltransferase